AYDWTSTANPPLLTVTLRNVGPSAVQITDYFINGQLVGTAAAGPNGLPCGGAGTTKTLTVGASCSETLTPPSTISQGVAYVVKVVSVDGAVFSYSAIAGSSS